MKKSAIALTTALLMLGSAYAADQTTNETKDVNYGDLTKGKWVTVAGVTTFVLFTALNEDEDGNTGTTPGTGTTTTSTGTGTGTTTTSVTN